MRIVFMGILRMGKVEYSDSFGKRGQTPVKRGLTLKKDQENAIDNDNYTHYNVLKFQF